ncbi:hypothetical protein WG66_005644 [Moniliophthora roreri]|nr:hypothetical protein WG66_005644 [Moniliophthora roreri]
MEMTRTVMGSLVRRTRPTWYAMVGLPPLAAPWLARRLISRPIYISLQLCKNFLRRIGYSTPSVRGHRTKARIQTSAQHRLSFQVFRRN